MRGSWEAPVLRGEETSPFSGRTRPDVTSMIVPDADRAGMSYRGSGLVLWPKGDLPEVLTNSGFAPRFGHSTAYRRIL